jgi:hypothetical protein
MRMAFRPPQTTGKTKKVPTVDVSGRRMAPGREVVMAIASRLEGAVRAAIGIAPMLIISKPAH